MTERFAWLPRTLLAAGTLAIVLLALPGCSYNRFTSGEEAIKGAWGEVQNQLMRRNDLIPNLVETVKGVAGQEQEVFGRIAESRAKLAGARTPEETIAAANEQSSALARLLAIVENYPQLRSSESFNRLMDFVPPSLWFFGKSAAMVFVMMWFRWTFPRMRVDQLMRLEWKILLPIGFVNLFAAAVMILCKAYFFPV